MPDSAPGTPTPDAQPLDPTRGALAAFVSSVVSNVGAVGVLMWLVTVQMPQQQEQFLTELRAERDVRERQTEKLAVTIGQLADEVRELRRNRP